MKVVLLEKLNKCGGIGDVVDVADGYARNYLLPTQRALRATKENIRYFEEQKEKIIAENLKKKGTAEEKAKALTDQVFFVLRQTSDKGHLYGSVTAKDIAELISEKFFEVKKEHIIINSPIKERGVHSLVFQPHSEVRVEIYVSVAPSLVEAENQFHSEGPDKERPQKGAAGTRKEKNSEETTEAPVAEEGLEKVTEASTETDAVDA
jgi:large subunit ribosomal protein L9